MSLTAADVAEIMRLVEQGGFDELNLEIDGIKLSLRRGAAAGNSDDRGSLSQVATVATPEVVASTPAPVVSAPSAAADPNAHDIASPLLGTFYRSPKPGAPPYVEVGSKVEEDTVVAIIEVMKLMNTVRAGVRGVVTEVLVTDGALAEYGQSLFRVRKAG